MITYFSVEDVSEEHGVDRQVTANNNDYRYLVFNFRGKGQIGTRIHGDNGKTIPYMTNDMDFTFATRSVLRNLNLLVLRGSQINTHMIGPCDFYGPLERPHLYLYSIKINDGFPIFYRRVKPIDHAGGGGGVDTNLSIDFTDCSATINAVWYKGVHQNIEEIKASYNSDEQHAIGESLFPTAAGLLVIQQESVELPDFDARQFDLSPFKARLVKNDIPFSMIDTAVSHKDSLCPISYLFEDEYAEEQVKKGGGLFLETHDFCQTMTPLDEVATGIVVLGRWINDDSDAMMLIGVRIPYGYTLIIDSGCIHGDTPLKGMYMMAMTSNHVTMQTADVVFLKNRENGKNFLITYTTKRENNTLYHYKTPSPIVHFGESGQFERIVNNGWSFYNPLSRIFNPFL